VVVSEAETDPSEPEAAPADAEHIVEVIVVTEQEDDLIPKASFIFSMTPFEVGVAPVAVEDVQRANDIKAAMANKSLMKIRFRIF
jgi:hypothetical protein